jgi:hypothetical protein
MKHNKKEKYFGCMKADCIKKEIHDGILVEREHAGTYAYINNFVKRNKRMPPKKEVYKHIALNHLSENKHYYKALKAAKL